MATCCYKFSFVLSIFLLVVNAQTNEDSIMVCRSTPKSQAPFSIPIGKPGKKGPAGQKGEPGKNAFAGDYIKPSCEQILRANPNAPDGIYDIHDEHGSVYRTFCSMKAAGGGWTLVASVHENNMHGKCTTGDRWSSEQGNTAAHPNGDGNWANLATFGRAESATSDDYKNPGYFNMQARDVMIWHVPNDTPLQSFYTDSFMMYYTKTEFLKKYGGNLKQLFSKHFKLINGVYTKKDNGPSIPITWIRGDNTLMIHNTPPNLRKESEAGYIQLRVLNNELGAFALCPGFRMKPNFGNAEHGCIGGTSNHKESIKHCGDFASKDWNGYGVGIHWSANKLITESVVMIFYR